MFDPYNGTTKRANKPLQTLDKPQLTVVFSPNNSNDHSSIQEGLDIDIRQRTTCLLVIPIKFNICLQPSFDYPAARPEPCHRVKGDVILNILSIFLILLDCDWFDAIFFFFFFFFFFFLFYSDFYFVAYLLILVSVYYVSLVCSSD